MAGAGRRSGAGRWKEVREVEQGFNSYGVTKGIDYQVVTEVGNIYGNKNERGDRLADRDRADLGRL